MRSQVEQFHFIVHYALRDEQGDFVDVETNLSVFDQKTLAIVQTIAGRRMFGFVGKGNFSLEPVRTGSGERAYTFERYPIFVRKGGNDYRWYARSYAAIIDGFQRRRDLDSADGGETPAWARPAKDEVPVKWLAYSYGHPNRKIRLPRVVKSKE